MEEQKFYTLEYVVSTSNPKVHKLIHDAIEIVLRAAGGNWGMTVGEPRAEVEEKDS